MKEEYKKIIFGVLGVIFGGFITVFILQNIAEGAFNLAMNLGETKEKITRTEESANKSMEDIEIQKGILNETAKQIDILKKKVTGMTGSEADERLKILHQLSDGLKSGGAAEKLLYLEKEIETLTQRSCSTETVWGRVDSCDDHVDWLPEASCPTGKFMSSIDIIAGKVENGWRCGFKIECC